MRTRWVMRTRGPPCYFYSFLPFDDPLKVSVIISRATAKCKACTAGANFDYHDNFKTGFQISFKQKLTANF